jgi:inorganic phosphate transporter, PiT family
MIETHAIFIIITILIAFIFDFTNGMHDSANSIATIVSTRVLSPQKAVVMAAFFNFISFFVFGTAVAKTIGSGMININAVTPGVVFCALIGAISWNIITWYFGIPTSSSHAIIGAYAGAAIARSGFSVILASGWTKTLFFIILAPLIGIVLGRYLRKFMNWMFYNKSPHFVNRNSQYLQIFSASLYSLGHGSNDAQKTMGIIASLLYSAGWIKTFSIPDWVAISACFAIAAGTLSGGWRIVKTMGQKITKLKPIDGFCSDSASAASIFFATHFGIPVSTTHVITGAISGVGSAHRISAVHWNVTLRIVWAWFLTIPAAAILAALVFYIFRFLAL